MNNNQNNNQNNDNSQNNAPNNQNSNQNNNSNGQYTYPNNQNNNPNGQYNNPNGQYNNPNGQYNNPNGQYNNPNGQYNNPNGQYNNPNNHYNDPNYNQYNNPNYNPYNQGPQKNGLSIASLILGIIALPFAMCYGGGIIFAIVSIIMGLISKKDSPDGKLPGMSIAGIICSVIAIIACIAMWIYLYIAFTQLMGTSEWQDFMNEVMEEYGSY